MSLHRARLAQGVISRAVGDEFTVVTSIRGPRRLFCSRALPPKFGERVGWCPSRCCPADVDEGHGALRGPRFDRDPGPACRDGAFSAAAELLSAAAGIASIAPRDALRGGQPGCSAARPSSRRARFW